MAIDFDEAAAHMVGKHEIALIGLTPSNSEPDQDAPESTFELLISSPPESTTMQSAIEGQEIAAAPVSAIDVTDHFDCEAASRVTRACPAPVIAIHSEALGHDIPVRSATGSAGTRDHDVTTSGEDETRILPTESTNPQRTVELQDTPIIRLPPSTLPIVHADAPPRGFVELRRLP